jgi:hypothetical protein
MPWQCAFAGSFPKKTRPSAWRPLSDASRLRAHCPESNSTYWLDPYRSSGRVVDASAWRKILGGGDLLVPTKLDVFIDRSIGLRHVQSAW